MNQFRVLRTSL